MEVIAKVRPSPAVTVKGKDGKEKVIPAFKGGDVKVNFTMPATLADMTKAYGEDVTYAAAKGSVIISLQAGLRRLVEGGKSQAECQAFTTAYKPDVRTVVKQSAMQKATTAAQAMTPAERAELLKQLQAMK